MQSHEIAKSRLEGVKPGSAEEAAIMADFREGRIHDTDELIAVTDAQLKAAADSGRVITAEAAQEARHAALDHVTGEFDAVKIPDEPLH
jgi:hypothetical protein